jgi:predicted NUDIX family NTP pyrophosphohydrolase
MMHNRKYAARGGVGVGGVLAGGRLRWEGGQREGRECVGLPVSQPVDGEGALEQGVGVAVQSLYQHSSQCCLDLALPQCSVFTVRGPVWVEELWQSPGCVIV